MYDLDDDIRYGVRLALLIVEATALWAALVVAIVVFAGGAAL
jgi:hypothetical protein